MSELRRRLRGLAREAGIALPVAMFAIVLVAILSSIVATAGIQLSDTTGQDRDEKRAFAAAQAGLNAQFKRLNAYGNVYAPGLVDPQKQPPDVHVQCIGDVPVEAIDSRTCPTPTQGSPGLPCGPPDDAGTGTRFYACATPTLDDAGCTGEFIPNVPTLQNQLDAAIESVSIGASVSITGDGVDVDASASVAGGSDPLFLYRCITAVGQVVGANGQVISTERLQQRVGAPFGMVANIVGNDGDADPANPDVKVNASQIRRPVTVTPDVGVVGTNGTVRIEPGGVVETDIASPNPDVLDLQGGSHTGSVRDRPPWALLPVSPPSQSRTDNDNGVVGGELTCTATSLLGCKYSSDPDKRELTITAGTWTLNPGIHNYCKVSISGTATVVTMADAQVFLDPTGCSQSDAGKLTISGGADVVVPTTAADSTVIYVKGRDDGGGPDTTIRGSGTVFTGALYAPQTKISVTENAKTSGALYGRQVWFTNGAEHLTLLPGVQINLFGATHVAYRRAHFQQCRDEPPSATNPQQCY